MAYLVFNVEPLFIVKNALKYNKCFDYLCLKTFDTNITVVVISL